MHVSCESSSCPYRKPDTRGWQTPGRCDVIQALAVHDVWLKYIHKLLSVDTFIENLVDEPTSSEAGALF